jgi:hypothetical protein
MVLWFASIGLASAQDVPYGVGEWPESLGNHRARVRVEQAADAVWVHLPWRRRDTAADQIEILVIDAATNKRVDNVVRVNIHREFGDLLFQPATTPGDYFIYYLPFRTEGPWYFPTTVYLPASTTAPNEWSTACQPLAERIRNADTAGIPTARVVEFQAINDFNRFDPMEIVASPAESEALLNSHPNASYLIFCEDRQRPIRMVHELPLHWVRGGPSDTFTGDARRGEFYAWQMGVFACRQPLENVTVTFSDMVSAEGGGRDAIPAAALRCLNVGGTDWLGRSFQKIEAAGGG